jgi:hypothetical protein
MGRSLPNKSHRLTFRYELRIEEMQTQNGMNSKGEEIMEIQMYPLCSTNEKNKK